jgi:hypothetical protein
MSFAEKWMKLEITTLSKISQAQKAKCTPSATIIKKQAFK